VNALDAEQAAVLKMVSTEELETSLCLSSPACGRLAQLGRFTWQGIEQGLDFIAFVGESTLTGLSLLLRPHQMRWRVLFSKVQTTGFSAVPIIGLLSFLLGVVIAYQAAVQLQAFGANIFIVDLVGISILREILLLQQPSAGSIRLFGQDTQQMRKAEVAAVRRRWGVLFQHDALFSGLTVAENVAVPLREHTSLGDGFIRELAVVKIILAGLSPDTARLYPRELSGGMRKRAALARTSSMTPLKGEGISMAALSVSIYRSRSSSWTSSPAETYTSRISAS
jgi:energy-coupling factor transporter ATP-binding protein EcfA2